jgi:hypothetical protein
MSVISVFNPVQLTLTHPIKPLDKLPLNPPIRMAITFDQQSDDRLKPSITKFDKP